MEGRPTLRMLTPTRDMKIATRSTARMRQRRGSGWSVPRAASPPDAGPVVRLGPVSGAEGERTTWEAEARLSRAGVLEDEWRRPMVWLTSFCRGRWVNCVPRRRSVSAPCADDSGTSRPAGESRARTCARHSSLLPDISNAWSPEFIPLHGPVRARPWQLRHSPGPDAQVSARPSRLDPQSRECRGVTTAAGRLRDISPVCDTREKNMLSDTTQRPGTLRGPRRHAMQQKHRACPCLGGKS